MDRGFCTSSMDTLRLLFLTYLEMTANNEFVTVRKSCLDLLWQHCHNCPDFGDQKRVFLQKCHTEIPSAPPREAPASKRRKTLPDLRAAEPIEPLNSSRKSRKKKDRARDSFLQNTPKASQWHKRQIEIAGAASKPQSNLSLEVPTSMLLKSPPRKIQAQRTVLL